MSPAISVAATRLTTNLHVVHCAACGHDDTKVIDSRVTDDGAAIRRRRQCPSCGHRVTTYERAEEVPLVVVKSHGGRQVFDRDKITSGILAAAKGRPVEESTIESVAEAIEDELRLVGPEITTVQIGLAVLNRLRELDDVAYLRFASVYKNFDAAEDFQRELTLLEKSATPG